MIKFLQGYKSYITSVAVATYAVLKAFGVINTTLDQDTTVFALLAALFGISLAAKIERKANEQVDENITTRQKLGELKSNF